jgi:hypothetical protein
MNALIVLSAVLAASQAELIAAPYAGLAGLPLGHAGALPLGYAGAFGGLPLGYNGALPINAYGAAFPYNGAPLATPLAAAPLAAAALAAPSSQFQAQDELGNINYGYTNINSAKHEVGNAYGGVTGSYSYVDANGLPQRVDYIADELGFRVQASNLPIAKSAVLVGPVDTGVAPLPVEDTAEVKAAKAEFQATFDKETKREKRQAILPLPYANAGLIGAPLAYNGLAAPLAYNGLAAPLAYNTVSAPAAREAIKTIVQLNPGHAVAYRVD